MKTRDLIFWLPRVSRVFFQLLVQNSGSPKRAKKERRWRKKPFTIFLQFNRTHFTIKWYILYIYWYTMGVSIVKYVRDCWMAKSRATDEHPSKESLRAQTQSGDWSFFGRIRHKGEKEKDYRKKCHTMKKKITREWKKRGGRRKKSPRILLTLLQFHPKNWSGESHKEETYDSRILMGCVMVKILNERRIF